jgi:N-acetylmuramoyl-L-alanine amidase
MIPFSMKIVVYQFIILMVGFFGQIALFPLPGLCFEKKNINVETTIVIDPGHGGNNHGAKGNDGALEKNLTLTLAKMISNHLQDQYRVLLTRSDDRDIPLSDRTALANHHKADFFISIHMGGAFEPDASGSFIMCYGPQKAKTLQFETGVPVMSSSQDPQPELWENLQLDHVSTSCKMAERFRSELKKRSSVISPKVENADVYVLSGATMPALLIEPFYLTHPDTERYYQETKNLERLAGDIAAGIRTILKKERS